VGCMPYLSIDSTTLNERWNGHLPSVIGVDGHNWIYPIAFGFFESETKESWTWFFKQLRKAIGHPPLLAICSDACKGLTAAVTNVFPEADKCR
jgi:transposase-like protein